MTVHDEKDFNLSSKCWVCGWLFTEGNNKVRYHDHVTSKHISSAYRDCNINLTMAKEIPVIFYNLRGYNSHLIS